MTDGEQSSPWQYVSPDSLSPSFEMVPSDPEHKTPDTKVPAEEPPQRHPEDPLKPLPVEGALRVSSEGQQLGVRSRVESSHRQDIRSSRSGVLTLQHSGGGGSSGDGVIVSGGGRDQRHPRPTMTSSSLRQRDSTREG